MPKKTKQLTLAGAVEAMLQHRAVYGVVGLEPGNMLVSELEQYEMFFEYENVPEPEPEKPVSAIVENESKKKNSKAGKPRNAKPIDDGRIMALYEAGWNLSSIALEVECSAQTVKNHLVAMGMMPEPEAKDVVEKAE